jgi:hypothetical protein
MIGSTDLLYPSPAPHFKTSQVLLIYCPKCPILSTIPSYAPNVVFNQFITYLLVHFKHNFAGEGAFFLLNADFAVAFLDLTGVLISP